MYSAVQNPTLDDHAASMGLGMRLFLIPEYRLFRKKFVSVANIRPGEVILDFGCGIGLLEEFLSSKIGETGLLVGVDIGPRLIAKARKRFHYHQRLAFSVIDDRGCLPFCDGTFDAIVANLVSHLLTRERKQRVYAEFKRILTPHGRLIMAEIGVPYNLFGFAQMVLSQHVWSKLWPYEKNSCDSYNGLIPELLGQAGFEITIVDRVKGFIDILVGKKQ